MFIVMSAISGLVGSCSTPGSGAESDAQACQCGLPHHHDAMGCTGRCGVMSGSKCENQACTCTLGQRHADSRPAGGK